MFGLPAGDLAWLAVAAFTAGLVRGFTGFGTAMIYLPVAGQILSPFGALTTLVLMDLVAPLPNVPRAIRDGQPADVARLGTGLVLAMPLGLLILTRVPPEAFRYGVSILALGLLTCLILGLRYQGRLSPPMVYGVGTISGLLGGAAGLAGPPVILFYMASPLPAHAVRGNMLLYLILTDIVMIPFLALFGRLETTSVLLGIALIVPCVLGNLAGAWLFRPGNERIYRAAAYTVIAASALSGLPLWD